MYTFNLAVCGGTFDHLHKGHKKFLQEIFLKSKKVLIGVTTDSFVEKKEFTSGIESYKKRIRELAYFLRTEKLLERTEITPIDSLFIPEKFKKLPINAIFVSADTIKGAQIINKKRKTEGRKELFIVTIPLIKAEDGDYISSTRIRQGIINREGRPYIKPLWFKKRLLITEKLRTELKKPFGTLHTEIKKLSIKNSSFIVTVGDVVTQSFNQIHLRHPLSVIDFLVERKKVFSEISEHGFVGNEDVVYVNNPAGTIMPQMFKMLIEIFSKQQTKRHVIVVHGEEDLVVLPVILVSPLGYRVFYGQPHAGIVEVIVSEKIKEKAYRILSNFTAK